MHHRDVGTDFSFLVKDAKSSQILFTLWYTKYTARESHSKILIKANYPIHCLNK